MYFVQQKQMSDLILYEKNLFGRIIVMNEKEEKNYQNQINGKNT
jgi:hypothetical protein